ncbi:MAG: alpha/beta fold hydrolase [Erythrobacter sp.]|uniref:alpha/beta fold hydrolase n=1 Tax=Erythrobacter sp. TaxID=1042 RepID=UPI0025DE0D3E|nr:alpha/beta fold hydrolase [Erythrobacter sp.]MCL9999255.1 alpha/beta fold hydrolase [Erythrobacter sp.]
MARLMLDTCAARREIGTLVPHARFLPVVCRRINDMEISVHFSSQGQGRPLLLVHGIGSSSRVWRPLLPPLISERTIIAVDLPGHGQSQPEQDCETFAGLVGNLECFLEAEGLNGVDMVGFSLGGRLVLELARRGRAGSVVALSPGGFWAGWERAFLQWTLLSSVSALRLLKGFVPGLAHTAVTRSAVLAQLSARPWALDGDDVEAELVSFTATSTFNPLVIDLAAAPMQEGPAAPSTPKVTIGWGRHDRLCFPSQARRAKAAFPGASLRWFDHSGHYLIWDEPARALEIIREGMR